MKFSVIIPTFNNLEYLKLCIDSIKKNSKYNHEIIVHNNGEKEPTNSYLQENKILFTYSGNNIGITAVRFMQNQSRIDLHRSRDPNTCLNENALRRHSTLWPKRKDDRPPGASLQTRQNFIEAVGTMYEC